MELQVESFSSSAKRIKTEQIKCPYLDTISRNVLDFDFEKLCSVSLSHMNVYACLICGKYFQGRGLKSYAYIHCLQSDHHVFLNLETKKFYCLPDDYEIVDSSLDDIIYLLDPSYSKEQVVNLDRQQDWLRAYDGTLYYPGIVGVNNIKANDYSNVVLLVLAHVVPIRNYFLRKENYSKIVSTSKYHRGLLLTRFGEFLRKLWNPENFRTHVSPHEILQAAVLISNKRFQIIKQGDCVEFVSWLLNGLHLALRGNEKLDSSVISRTFCGKMRVYTRKMLPISMNEKERRVLVVSEEYQETSEDVKYFFLPCDLPPAPLYPDAHKEIIIPQVPLQNLLEKFNGIREHQCKTYKDNFVKRYQLLTLPPYLIIHIKRITKNYFRTEKNPTIVNFPLENVDFGDCLIPSERINYPSTTYNLVGNIVHDGDCNTGTYRTHILHKGTGKWFEMQDLHVQEVLSQMITLTESLILVYERHDINNFSRNGK